MEDRGRELLKQHGARIVFRAHAALFLDHLDFLGELFVRPLVVGKAVCFQRHHLTQAIGRNLLVVARVVTIGKSVFLPAQRSHAARELTRRQLFGALEHHVLKHVGHAGRTIDFIHGTHAQPHHIDGSGCTVIWLNDQLHAVAQSKLLRSCRWAGRRRAGSLGRRHG